MKVSEAPSNIIGIQIGEANLNFLRVGVSNLKVRFALLTDNGAIGFMDLDAEGGQWSQKTLDAMKTFTEALEEDGLRVVFKLPNQAVETTSPEGTPEPAQF